MFVYDLNPFSIRRVVIPCLICSRLRSPARQAKQQLALLLLADRHNIIWRHVIGSLQFYRSREYLY